MAPGKRRKKPVANPARGFATTSVPSKTSTLRDPTKHVEAQDQLETTDEIRPGETASPGVAGSSQGNSLKPSDDIKDMSAEELQDHFVDAELQFILDVHRTRCNAEAARAVAKLKAERRTLRAQAVKVLPISWLSDALINDVVRSVAAGNTCAQIMTDSRKAAQAQDQVLLRLWVLAQVLNRLQFPQVDNALMYILQLWRTDSLRVSKEDCWGLPEAFDWYALHVDPDELPSYEGGALGNIMALNGIGKEGGSRETVEDANLLGSETDSQDESRYVSPETEGQYRGHIEIGTESDDDNDPALLGEKYIRLKSLLLMSEQGVHDEKLSHAAAARARRQLDSIEADVLFDDYEASALWREREADLQADIASRKKELNVNAIKPKQAPDNENKRIAQIDAPLETDIGIGDLFERLLDHTETEREDQAEEDSDAGEGLVQVVDFGDWAGIHPRKLLADILKSRDARAQTSLAQVSTSRKAYRHKLVIQWSTDQPQDPWLAPTLSSQHSLELSARRLQIEMKTIAMPTSRQSEGYISTVALFAISAYSSTGNKISSRLALVWRKLWADLSARWQMVIDDSDKGTLKRLQTMIDTATVTQCCPATTVADVPPPSTRTGHLEGPHQSRTLTKTPEAYQIQSDWSARSASPRYLDMLVLRKDLPIHQHKGTVLATIAQHPVTIIAAETGAGKSTQVPSFVLESALSSGRDCRILVTQPRRISAITLARRVSQELGERIEDLGSHKSLVGYAIRLETKTSPSTRITFATTGVLLRMLESSPELDELDHIILDEIHERTMDLDLLLIALRRLVIAKPRLKLILMSATIDSQKLSDYFGGAPVLNISGRTYPVEVRFLEDAVEATLDHLVVAPSKSRVEEDEVGDIGNNDSDHREQIAKLEDYSTKTRLFLTNFNEYRIDYNLITQLARTIATNLQYKKFSSAILIFMPGLSEIRRLHSTMLNDPIFLDGWEIHLLHSTFSSDDLERAFKPPPHGTRKIVIATNIAETGITIPDVTAVIDTCKEKMMRYDERRQLSKLVETFVSRSSSRQRRGRAARVQEGLCFHLVTKHRFENLMPEQHIPEMLRLSLQDPILRAKIWNLGDVGSTLGAAIDPPTPKNIRRAVEVLKEVGALSKLEDLTPLGRLLARLPLDVELGKLVILGVFFRCLDPAITMTAILSSSKSLFLGTGGRQSTSSDGPLPFAHDDSDLLYSCRIYQAWKKSTRAGTAAAFCRKYFLSEQSLAQIEDQKIQLLVSIADAGLLTLTETEQKDLRKARIGGPRRQCFDVPDRYQLTPMSNDCMLAIVAMAFYPKLLVREGKGWRNVATNQQVNITPESVNKASAGSFKWMSFYQAIQTRTGRLNVTQTSRVPDSVILLVLGQADFRLYSGVVKLDMARVQLALTDWKEMTAARHLRDKIAGLLDAFFQSPSRPLSSTNLNWYNAWLAIVNHQTTSLDIRTV